MTRLFEQAIEAARKLTPEEQDEIARTILDLVAPEDGPPYELSPEDKAAITQGLASADRGDFASEEEVAAILARHRV